VISAPSSAIFKELHQLCDQLVALQLEVEISVETLCGESDVRLRVSQRHDPDRTVELLAPDPTAWSSRNWDAVCVQHGCRRVWRGPGESCSLDDVATFVHALVCLDAARLTPRYVALS
jgi:hypothetical protein